MMNHISISLLSIFIFSQVAFSQTAKQYLKAADREFEDKNYYSAMKHYEEAMEIEGEQLEVLLKYANAARLMNAFTFADTAYTKVLTVDSTGNYPLAIFWSASVKKNLGDYLTSQHLFQLFSDEYATEFPEYAEQASQKVEELDWAIVAITEEDQDVIIEQLDERLNSHVSEFAPIRIGDEIYFSTQNNFRQVDKKKDPKPFSTVMKTKVGSNKIEAVEWNDTKRHTAHTTFTKDGRRVYYTLCDYVGETTLVNCEIYYRNIGDMGEVGEPIRLPASINQPDHTATDPRIGFNSSTGEDWLFFVSDKDGGKGGTDIWATVIKNDTTFTPPVNLAAINTDGDETSPMFHDPSQTLYFSSNGRQGFGGFDIYKSVLKDDKWQEIEHMPAPFNTSYDDSHFWLNHGRTNGYIASSRLGSKVLEPEYEACCYDLYKFTVLIVDLNVLTYNKKGKTPLNGVSVELHELTENGKFKLAASINEEGNNHPFELRRGTKYEVIATRPGFLPIRDTIDMGLSENNNDRSLERKLYLTPETVDLEITSFNKKTMNPLKSVEVRLVVDGQEVDFRKNEEGNDVTFELNRGELYQVIGSKVAYFSDTVMIDLRNDVTTIDIKEDLLLQPKEIEDFPPLVIYFDNDRPNPKTRKTTTEKDYKETWEDYMAQKEIYRKEYVKSLVGFDSITSSRRMEAFFEREVNNGFLSLEVFTENILEIMEDGGFKVELVIQGFTSPRASADYNYNLSQRRADCLKNHFERWQGGILNPYIQQGRITLEVVGYGEKLAPQFISDRLDDERESIYSVQASFERKVAIIGARRVAEN